MPQGLTAFVKALFRVFGFDIRRADPAEDNHAWLTRNNISCVLDVGANTGQFARKIHKLVPNAVIFSFEPIDTCYQKLIKNMADVPNFRAFNYALGDTDDEIQMHVNEFTPSSSLLSMTDLHKRCFPYAAHECIQRVKVKRLDVVARGLALDGNVLIKMDVQGYEDRVIRGGQNVISRAKMLIVETSFPCLYVDQPLFDDIYDMLRKLGFRYAGNLEQLRSPLDGSILQADSIFVRDGEWGEPVPMAMTSSASQPAWPVCLR